VAARGPAGSGSFIHAKYGVIDGERAFVQSENWRYTGLAIDPTYGNRGWGVVVHDPGVASFLTQVFGSDWNPDMPDSVPFTPGDPVYGDPSPDFAPDRTVPRGPYRHPFPAVTFPGPHTVTPILAPDHSLYQSRGILGLIRGARKTLYVEQQYIQPYSPHCPPTFCAGGVGPWAARRR
jgi:phosphatidylserine/phosphatidylglycerophosphate/cardiolipin synthase-like enzyme